MRLIAKADVVLALGTRLGPFGTLPQYDIDYWPKNAKIIQVDVDASQLGLSKKIDIGIMADAKEFAHQLVLRLRAIDANRASDSKRLEEIEKEKKIWKDELDRWSSSTNKLMHPRRFLKELTRRDAEGFDRRHRHREQLVHLQQLPPVFRSAPAHIRAQLG
jgi:sulfoacetaldehyde acetyltransferase